MTRTLEPQLLDAGMTPAAAARKAATFRELLAAIGSGEPSPHIYHVPGRLEVLGKHTDYAGGRSIVAAVEQGFAVVAAARDDGVLNIRDLAAGEVVEFPADPDLQPTQGTWANYPMTVARRVARNFPGPLRGADILFSSDLPVAAGMSSSSALMIACFMVLSGVNQLAQHDEYRANITSCEQLASYLAAIENGQSFGTLRGNHGVGTFGGSEDHTAILCSRAGHLSQYNFAPTRREQAFPVPDEYVFAIAASGVVAEKTRAAREKYNLISRRTAEIVALWRRETGRDDATLAAAVRSAADAPDRLRAILASHRDEALVRRLDQFIEESERIIPAFADAARGFALGGVEVGELVDRSQALAETHLMNQVPQTIALARAAREQGATAASAFGAGFGGSVWALVRREQGDAFIEAWSRRYAAAFPIEARQARFFLTAAASAAVKLAAHAG